jgi:hypothetical protein
MTGRTLVTVTGRAFGVGTSLDSIVFTPASTGLGRSDGRKAGERFVGHSNATGSVRPADYAGVTRNASYYLGLVLAEDDRDGSAIDPDRRAPRGGERQRAMVGLVASA